MFEKIDNRIGSQMRRRAVAVIAVAALALPVAAVIANGSQAPRTEPTSLAANSKAARTELPNPAVDLPATDFSPAGLDGATSEPTPTTEVAPPATDTAVPPTTQAPPATDPPVPPSTEPVPPATDPPVYARIFVADLVPAFGSGMAGESYFETPEQSVWNSGVFIENLVPNVDHQVSVQWLTADGELSDIMAVCEGRSDATGAFTCSTTFEMADPGRYPSVVTVSGYEPSSNGYRAVAHGDLVLGDVCDHEDA